MSEEAQKQAQPSVNVITQYIRDMSFENIAAQKSLKGDLKPEISVQVNLDAQAMEKERFELILKLNVTAKSEGADVFLLELEYAGQFVIKGVPEEQLHAVLMIECPRLLFPFARRIIRDVTADGGFPPLNVDNIDFVMLYRNEIERRRTENTNSDKPLI
ncbi:MAG: protein-export chaperone SecB [Pseudomonadota bacterium]